MKWDSLKSNFSPARTVDIRMWVSRVLSLSEWAWTLVRKLCLKFSPELLQNFLVVQSVCRHRSHQWIIQWHQRAIFKMSREAFANQTHRYRSNVSMTSWLARCRFFWRFPSNCSCSTWHCRCSFHYSRSLYDYSFLKRENFWLRKTPSPGEITLKKFQARTNSTLHNNIDPLVRFYQPRSRLLAFSFLTNFPMPFGLLIVAELDRKKCIFLGILLFKAGSKQPFWYAPYVSFFLLRFGLSSQKIYKLVAMSGA